MIGIVVHSRSCRQTSMPSPSGSTRSMIAACGGRTAALSSASVAVDAGSTSKPASRRITRSARRICGSSSQTSTRCFALMCPRRWRRAPARRAASSSAGNSTTKLVPWPGSDSTDTRPPLASTNPRTIASPSPEPRWPALALPAR